MTGGGNRSLGGKLAALRTNVEVFGLAHTARAVLAHAHLVSGPTPDGFDRRYGVSTGGEVEVADSDLPGPHRAHAVKYQATHERVMEHVLAHLPVRPETTSFVDVGCGKGKAVLMAAMRPFAFVLGVELSPAYCAIARRNLARFPAEARRCEDVEILCADATAFPLPAGDTAYYLFNPFEAPVLEPLLERIRTTAEAATRTAVATGTPAPRVLVAFCNPRVGTELLDRMGFRCLRETVVISPDWNWSLWEWPG